MAVPVPDGRSAASLPTYEAIRRLQDDYTLLHAGVVQLGARRVVLPGSSDIGKSTLVAGLVRAGWDYLSDELAVIDPTTGEVRPYPRPIGIDPGAHHLFPELLSSRRAPGARWHVDPAELRAEAVVGMGGEMTCVVFPRFEHAAPTVLKPLSAAHGCHRLLESAVSIRAHPRRDFAVIADVAEVTPCLELTSGCLREQIACIQHLAEDGHG